MSGIKENVLTSCSYSITRSINLDILTRNISSANYFYSATKIMRICYFHVQFDACTNNDQSYCHVHIIFILKGTSAAQ